MLNLAWHPLYALVAYCIVEFFTVAAVMPDYNHSIFSDGCAKTTLLSIFFLKTIFSYS